jgi:hypothetical protein
LIDNQIIPLSGRPKVIFDYNRLWNGAGYGDISAGWCLHQPSSAKHHERCPAPWGGPQPLHRHHVAAKPTSDTLSRSPAERDVLHQAQADQDGKNDWRNELAIDHVRLPRNFLADPTFWLLPQPRSASVAQQTKQCRDRRAACPTRAKRRSKLQVRTEIPILIESRRTGKRRHRADPRSFRGRR